MSAEPSKSCHISLIDTSCKSLQAALREARKEMEIEDVEQDERKCDRSGSLLNKSSNICLDNTSCKSLQGALREARKEMEDTEQEEQNWDRPGSLLQSFRGGLPSGVTAAALAAAESPQSGASAPLPPRPPCRQMPPKLPGGPGTPAASQQATDDVTPPPSTRSDEPKSAFLTAGLLSKMKGFEAIPITDDNPTVDSLSYSMTRSLGSSFH